jgi:hypothetical protein
MDMSRYASAAFINVEDLVNGPQQKTITEIEEGPYKKPVVTFDDGTRLSLNKTSVSALIRAYGKDSNGFIAQRIEIYAGTVRYNGNDAPAVLVRPLSPPIAAKPKAEPQSGNGPDDEVPFV